MNAQNPRRVLFLATLALATVMPFGCSPQIGPDLIHIRFRWPDRKANTLFIDRHGNSALFSKTPDLNLEGISEIGVAEGGDGSTLLILHFNEVGSKTMSRFVRGTIGVFADGQLVSTLMILPQQKTLSKRLEKLQITVPIQKWKARRIADRANRWIASRGRLGAEQAAEHSPVLRAAYRGRT